MIKLVYFLRKRAEISSEELYRYWLNDHGPLVRKFAAAIQATKYVQSHTIAPEMNQVFQESRGLAEPYDGITEVWWQDLASLKAGMESEAGRKAHQALMEDEAKFVDFSQTRVFMTEEHTIFGS
jgi:uncharacterized protein (TIGR02118 family)